MLASPRKHRRDRKMSSSAKGYRRPDFNDAFTISVKIGQLEDELKHNHKLRKRQRTIKQLEIQELKDELTRGKTRFAAEQHRALLNATLKIIRGQEVATIGKMTVAAIIRELQLTGADTYENRQGQKIRYDERSIREILDKKLNLTEGLKSIKYMFCR